MRIARTLAAAALAAALTSGLAPAALAAASSPAPASHSVSSHHGKKPAKDKAKLDLHARGSVEAGDAVALRGRLTHSTGKGYKPAAGLVVVVSLQGSTGSSVVGEATTDAKGRYTLTYTTTADQVGSRLRLKAAFAGDAQVKAVTSKAVTVKVQAPDDGSGDDDGDDDGGEHGPGGDHQG